MASKSSSCLGKQKVAKALTHISWLASLCFSDDQLRTYPWSLRAGTKEPAELLSCATILELWGFYCHSSVTSVVRNLIVISSGCLGSVIYTRSVSDKETGLLRAQVTFLKPHYGLQAVLSSRIMCSLPFCPLIFRNTCSW